MHDTGGLPTTAVPQIPHQLEAHTFSVNDGNEVISQQSSLQPDSVNDGDSVSLQNNTPHDSFEIAEITPHDNAPITAGGLADARTNCPSVGEISARRSPHPLPPGVSAPSPRTWRDTPDVPTLNGHAPTTEFCVDRVNVTGDTWASTPRTASHLTDERASTTDHLHRDDATTSGKGPLRQSPRGGPAVDAEEPCMRVIPGSTHKCPSQLARADANVTTESGADAIKLGGSATELGADATEIDSITTKLEANTTELGTSATELGDSATEPGVDATELSVGTTARGGNATNTTCNLVWRGWERQTWRRSNHNRRGTVEVPRLDKTVISETAVDQQIKPGMAVDLCSGCGGLALAASQLGYKHAALVDSNPRCIDTLRSNGFDNVILSELANMNWTKFRGVALLTAGLSCQPYSKGGLGKGAADDRDLWPEGVRAVREIMPHTFMFEMVEGFMSERHREHREAILRELSDLGYLVQTSPVNTKNEGLPQNRKRILITGHLMCGNIIPPQPLPLVTLRDALADLGSPNELNRHEHHGPSGEYRGHRPSIMDGQANTIRAGGNHGLGGGNNTVRDDDGDRRYFTIREMARIQGFPDSHKFDPVWTHAVREVGNACPPAMARRWLLQLQQKLPRSEWPMQEATIHQIRLEEPTLQNNLCNGIDPLDDEPHSLANLARMRAIGRELNRRSELIAVLQAQAHVLQADYSMLVNSVANHDIDHLKILVERIKNDARWIEDGLGPTMKDAMVAALSEVKPAEGTPNVLASSDSLDNVRRAAARAMELAKTVHEMQREHRLAAALQREKELPADRAAYLNMLDTQPVNAPGDDAELHVWDVEANQQISSDTLPDGRRIYTRIPRSLLELPDSAGNTQQMDSGDSEPFFNPNAIMRIEEEGGFKYQSMKADLRLEGPNGSWATINSIVDSGAAWCAIRESTLRESLPELHKLMQPSSMRFHDASGRLMSLRGRIPLRIRVGTEMVDTTAYVFKDLGAPFLLGANALWGNGCMIDCNKGRLYVHGDKTLGVPMTSATCAGCELTACKARNKPEWQRCIKCPTPEGRNAKLVCDREGRCVNLVGGDSDVLLASVQCERLESNSPSVYGASARLVLDEDITVNPGCVMTLSPKLEGVAHGTLAAIEMEISDSFQMTGLLVAGDTTVHNPTSPRCPFTVKNPTSRPITIAASMELSHQIYSVEEDTVLVAAVLDEKGDTSAEAPPGVDDGGVEFLHKLGLSFEAAIDPDNRLEDGSYAPLPWEKKRALYEIALRWYHVWSTDAKVPKISYLVVIDIPTGSAAPIAQQPYPIPAKLRSAAMDEINKLLKAGLIEPSISDWSSPTLVRVKKDSTASQLRVKLAIDYRRVNAVTELDAGGLGTQSDILYGVGGKFKFLGLMDAAGGFYQYLLSPRARNRSAFILPASMGGTLFQWRVAPYGLTRNPAGYSRGMQWVLKGLHDLTNLGPDCSDKAGATSWLDDICMRATTFGSFIELFELILSRLAAAGMTLKGEKCELLCATLDVLGFTATPHGLMLQTPKLSAIMEKAVPETPKDAGTFLGSVAFLRRMVPRISLLAAPMIAAMKSFEKRSRPGPLKPGERQPRKLNKTGAFNEKEQEQVRQSWEAIVEHLDSDAVLVAPDFEDPLAHFVICTDASDVAVGGVLMQWQHSLERGPGPPSGTTVNDPGKDSKGRPIDPLDSKWRIAAGWKLKVVGYYSKTLVDAQKNYCAFDKEAGAALVCCRHWADLITYHPTTLYTDSSVAASMLTKHSAPTRLQRWGAELGSFLPHLRIAYRKGCDNGLADLLSRFPTFNEFTKLRTESVELPDDFFDYIGEAPLYHRIPCSRPSKSANAVYKLYEPKLRPESADSFWSSSEGAPEIVGRAPKSLPDKLVIAALVAADESRHGLQLEEELQLLREHVAGITQQHDPVGDDHDACLVFQRTYGEPPTFALAGAMPCTRDIERAVDAVGGILTSDVSQADLVIHSPVNSDERTDRDDVEHVMLVSADSTPRDSVRIGQRSHALECSFPLHPRRITLRGGEPSGASMSSPFDCSHQNHLPLQCVLNQGIGNLLHRRHEMPLPRPDESSALTLMREQWSSFGYGSPVLRTDLRDAMPQQPDVFSIFGMDDAEAETPRTVTKSRTRSRLYPWQDAESRARVSAAGDTDGGARDEDGQATARENDASPDADEGDLPPPIDPASKITLDEQLKDPKVRLLVNALRGRKSIPHAQRARIADKYELDDDGVHRFVINNGEVGRALVVPKHMRAAVLAARHYSLIDGGGHTGARTMYEQLSAEYYWPEMFQECEDFVAACHVCGSVRSQAAIGAAVRASPTPGAPFQVIHVDHKGPLTLSGGYTHVLVVVCALTRYTLFIPVADTKGLTTLNALRDHVFSVFGYPLVIVSDNGTATANKLMKASERLYGFRSIHVMPHTPQANGLAEAGVKKLKLILDRHTLDYQGWHSLLGMAQTTVNQRISTGTQESPFVALFGRQPVTLTALENPSLLPTNTPEERTVSGVAHTLGRLQRRLQDESDQIKDLAVHNAHSHVVRRVPRKGDKIWLNYSDGERSRYLRKHGHGTAWRHAFEVDKVKPHAVKLIVPKDGSVPDVLPWQSLRKCSFAAPHFHDEDMPIPLVDPSGAMLAPDLADPDGDREPTTDEPPPNGGYTEWTATTLYDIERIASAKRMGKGWQVRVKWVGYDDLTDEPLYRIVKTLKDPELLKQLEECKATYLAEHPREQELIHQETEPRPETTRPEPTRIQPSRERNQTARFSFHAIQLDPTTDDAWLVPASLKALRSTIALRCSAMPETARADADLAMAMASPFCHRSVGMPVMSLRVGALTAQASDATLAEIHAAELEVDQVISEDNGCGFDIFLDDAVDIDAYPLNMYPVLRDYLCSTGPPSLGDLHAMYCVIAVQLQILLADAHGVIGVIRHSACNWPLATSAVYDFFRKFPPKRTYHAWRTQRTVLCTIGSPYGHVDRMSGGPHFEQQVSTGAWPVIPSVLPLGIAHLQRQVITQPFDSTRPEKYGLRRAVFHWVSPPPTRAVLNGGEDIAHLRVGASPSDSSGGTTDDGSHWHRWFHRGDARKRARSQRWLEFGDGHELSSSGGPTEGSSRAPHGPFSRTTHCSRLPSPYFFTGRHYRQSRSMPSSPLHFTHGLRSQSAPPYVWRLPSSSQYDLFCFEESLHYDRSSATPNRLGLRTPAEHLSTVSLPIHWDEADCIGHQDTYTPLSFSDLTHQTSVRGLNQSTEPDTTNTISPEVTDSACSHWPPATPTSSVQWQEHVIAVPAVLATTSDSVTWTAPPEQRALRSELLCPVFVRETSRAQATLPASPDVALQRIECAKRAANPPLPKATFTPCKFS